MESMIDIPTAEDNYFIVDDGYNHDEDPTYEPKDSSSSDEDDKHVVTGKEFKKLTKRAKKLGAESFDYSTRKKKTNTWQHFQLERKFILGQRNIQTF